MPLRSTSSYRAIFTVFAHNPEFLSKFHWSNLEFLICCTQSHFPESRRAQVSHQPAFHSGEPAIIQRQIAVNPLRIRVPPHVRTVLNEAPNWHPDLEANRFRVPATRTHPLERSTHWRPIARAVLNVAPTGSQSGVSSTLNFHALTSRPTEGPWPCDSSMPLARAPNPRERGLPLRLTSPAIDQSIAQHSLLCSHFSPPQEVSLAEHELNHSGLTGQPCLHMSP